jgi:hypothetical protein
MDSNLTVRGSVAAIDRALDQFCALFRVSALTLATAYRQITKSEPLLAKL